MQRPAGAFVPEDRGRGEDPHLLAVFPDELTFGPVGIDLAAHQGAELLVGIRHVVGVDEILGLKTDGLLGLVAKHLAECAIGVGHPAIKIDQHGSNRPALQHVVEERVAVREPEARRFRRLVAACDGHDTAISRAS